MNIQSGPIRSKYEKIKAESDSLQEATESFQSQIGKYKEKIESLKDVSLLFLQNMQKSNREFLANKCFKHQTRGFSFIRTIA